MSKYLFVSTITVLLLLQSCIVLAAIEITGTITAKRGDLVKVVFTPNKTASPKVGDKVNFSTTQAGIPINCGAGNVTEVDGNTVWIKPAKNNLKLKMNAAIQATGSPAPIEYTIDLPGFDLDYGWAPDAKFIFKFTQELTPDAADPTYAVKFPGGAYLYRPHYSLLLALKNGRYIVRSLKEAHRERIESFQSRKLEYVNKVRIVWNRKIQGINSVFYVTQVIVTRAIGKKIERNQEFLISFVTPKPPPDSRKLHEIMWEMSFKIPDDFDEQFRPEYWEKIFLEIMQTASVANNP